jgi:Inner membrane component of T3SS, cytoplasmic domain/Inner membrane component of T3SS, periplasmic domain
LQRSTEQASRETTAMTASTASQQPPQQAGVIASPPPVTLKFEVIAGAHRGAVLLLDGTDYRIGSSPDADIVLSDPGIAPEHAVLQVDRGRVRIGATGADMTVGQEPLPLSRGCRVKLPVNIALGSAQIRLSDPDGKAPGRELLRQSLTAAAAVACCVLVIAVAVEEWPRAAGILTVAVTAGSADAGASEHSPAISSAGPAAANAAATAEDAVRALNERLDAAGIRTLRINAENGRLAATGTLSAQEAAGWAAIQQWFDQTYGGRIVLTTRIEPPGSARPLPALQLQAIWYGERSYIVTAGGEHYFVGAVLDNGWIIREIGEDRLLLGKDGDTVALTYR